MKSRRVRVVFLVVLICLAAAAAGLWIAVRLLAGKSNYRSDADVALQTETETQRQLHAEDVYDVSQVRMAGEERTKGTFCLLVIGGDTPEAEEEGNRKDAEAVILMIINHNMKMAWFGALRTDLYVQYTDPALPPAGSLGHAYALGGGPLLSDVIEANYGIPVDNYASVSLKDVAEVIGMPEFEQLDISEDGLSVVKELVYSMNAVKPAQIAGYISGILPFVTHNIDSQDMMRIILQIPAIVGYYPEEELIPYEGTYMRLDGYTVPDIGYTSRRMQDMAYGVEPETEELETEELESEEPSS